MKYMIASDIHGSAYYCEKLLDRFNEEKADRLVLLGDLLYHGPRNYLPMEYEPKRVIEVDQMVLEFPIMAEYCLITEGKQLIMATHGHTFNLENPPKLQKGDILLHGHTHVPANIETETFRYLNPGSVSLPKDGSANSYMTLENGCFIWKDLDGKEYERWTGRSTTVLKPLIMVNK